MGVPLRAGADFRAQRLVVGRATAEIKAMTTTITMIVTARLTSMFTIDLITKKAISANSAIPTAFMGSFYGDSYRLARGRPQQVAQSAAVGSSGVCIERQVFMPPSRPATSNPEATSSDWAV